MFMLDMAEVVEMSKLLSFAQDRFIDRKRSYSHSQQEKQVTTVHIYTYKTPKKMHYIKFHHLKNTAICSVILILPAK